VSRVPLVTAGRAPLLARPYFNGGDPGPIVAALATVPELLEATLPFVGVALGPSALDARTKELAVLRTSSLLQCGYCVQARSVVALDVGMTVAEIRSLCDPAASLADAFPAPRERVLLAWVDVVAGERGPVPDPVADALTCHFRDFEVVELAVTVGATMFLNRFCTALELEPSAATLARLADVGLA
jgi:AhpD family alkylhydroperoxidase